MCFQVFIEKHYSCLAPAIAKVATLSVYVASTSACVFHFSERCWSSSFNLVYVQDENTLQMPRRMKELLFISSMGNTFFKSNFCNLFILYVLNATVSPQKLALDFQRTELEMKVYLNMRYMPILPHSTPKMTFQSSFKQ